MRLVTISGYPGSGTTTAVALLRGSLGLPSYNVGDAFRAIAKERGMGLIELHSAAKLDRGIDSALDSKQLEVAAAGNVILEGRLAGFLTKRAGINGVRVWLRAPFDVRASRVSSREGIPLNRAKDEIRARETAERTRYIEFYGFDLDDLSVYDLVIDTDVTPPEAVAELILTRLENYDLKEFKGLLIPGIDDPAA